jgi:hypothetical protein
LFRGTDGRTKRERTRNYIVEEMGVQNLLGQLAEKLLQWSGHVNRMYRARVHPSSLSCQKRAALTTGSLHTNNIHLTPRKISMIRGWVRSNERRERGCISPCVRSGY